MKKTHKENNTKVIIPKEIITYLMDLPTPYLRKIIIHTLSTQTYFIDDILRLHPHIYLMRHIITSPIQLK